MTNTNQWQLDFNDVDKLVSNIGKLSKRSETVINNTLDKKGIPLAEESIQPTIPVSMRKGRVINKKHARNYKALSSERGNLEFVTRPKPRFNYLKYPDLAIGTSQYNTPKQFMKRGMDKAAPKIMDELSKDMIKDIDNTLGGK